MGRMRVWMGRGRRSWPVNMCAPICFERIVFLIDQKHHMVLGKQFIPEYGREGYSQLPFPRILMPLALTHVQEGAPKCMSKPKALPWNGQLAEES